MDKYEKKYNDLVNDLKELWNCHTNDSQLLGELAEICPELSESEDERIRKWLYDYISNCPNNNFAFYGGVGKDAVLNYLEKQKEQSIMANDLDEEIHRFFNDCIDVHEAKLYGSISKRVIHVDCYELTARHFAKWGKRQKESENISASTVIPSCWAEEPSLQKNQKHPNGCFTCDEYKKGYEAGRLNGFTAGYNKAMKEVDQKEQKPAEWSEEDEKMRVNILNALIPQLVYSVGKGTYTGTSTYKYDDEIKWLKSLRPQPYTVSIENATKFGNLEYERGIKDGIQSEKSRHWKPSEEQIYSLGTVVKGYDECTVGSVGYHLKEMYEQLKKLM